MLKCLPALPHVALIALITLAIPGCHKERSYPVYRENPAPKDALPIVIRVRDAPVELAIPKVFVSYEIDPLCLPPINNYEGVQYAPQRQSVEFPVRRVSATEFSSTVFEDGMAVADYYGRGPCEWKPSIIQASFPVIADGREGYISVSVNHLELKELLTSISYADREMTTQSKSATPAWVRTQSMYSYAKLADIEKRKYFPIEISSHSKGIAP
ncbi:hypothetical protein [Stenotrophomonas indicatrix]|uniref:hypothetical protein n=1 Tax=Stenotrophomonas indicatrix TaxID=2045451 RepID=UPI00320AED60